VSRESEGQSDNSQGRVGKTARRKNRAAGDEKIRHVVHPTIGIDHAVSRIVVHPGSAQEVMRAVKSPGLGADGFSSEMKVPMPPAANSSRKFVVPGGCCAYRARSNARAP
jgi:hypothetical protein